MIGPVKVGKKPTIGLQEVRNLLKSKGVPINVVFKIKNEDESNETKEKIDTTRVNMLTVHQSKGLEFDVILLLDPIHEMNNRKP